MKLETLRAMLDRTAKPKGSIYRLADEETFSLLISADGQEFSINRVSTVEICQGFIEAKTSRGERFLLEAESVVAVRLGAKGSEATGAGFFNHR